MSEKSVSPDRGPAAPTPERWTLNNLATVLGLGFFSDETTFRFLFDREKLLREVQDALETHKSDAPDARAALMERIESLRAAAAAPPPSQDLRDVIERVRVECSQHRDSDWVLGAVYALDTLKHRIFSPPADALPATPQGETKGKP